MSSNSSPNPSISFVIIADVSKEVNTKPVNLTVKRHPLLHPNRANLSVLES